MPCAAFANVRGMKGPMPTVIWIILVVLLCISFRIDFRNVAQGGAIDLRNRITGIRLLVDGIDPYHYKWTDGAPPEYCDPFNNPRLPISKTTATPALLLLHAPIAFFPYGVAQWLWFLIQWALLLGAAGLWFRRYTQNQQRLWLAALVTAFTYTAAWRLHAERGQSYVVLLFLFAWWLTATLNPKTGNHFVAGLLAGILVTLRPPFLILAPFLLLHRRGQLPGAIAGLVLGIGLPLLVNPHCWSDYASAMQTNSELYRTGQDTPAFPPTSYPSEIEGIPIDTLAHFAVIPYADFSIHGLLRLLGLEPFPDFPLLLAVSALFIAWLWWMRKQRLELVLLGVAAWFFIIDLFLPAYRNNYNDVLILNVAALAILSFKTFPRLASIGLLAFPLGWIIYYCTPEEKWLINLPSLALTLATILFLFLSSHLSISKPATKSR